MYPSKQHVSCFYCEWIGRRDKSREHWKSKHPSEKFRLKISENNLGKYYFQKETIEKTRTTTNDDDTDKNEEEEQANVILLSPCGTTSTASVINTITSPSISVLGTPSVPSTPSNISTSFSPTKSFKSPNSIQDQLVLMAKQLSKISDVIENIHIEKTTKESSSLSTQADDFEQTFESIKCSDDFFMLKGLEINDYLDTITCIPCSTWKKQAPKHLLTSIKSSFGTFQYVEQKRNEPLSERFRNLKKHLKTHFANKLHTWCIREQEERKREFEEFVKKNEKAGLNIGRAALFSIRSGLGGLKFVETINLLDLSGAAVGTYRHSRWFFEKIRASMANTMKERVVEYLQTTDPITQRRRAFGLTFDKVTLLKRSMQITMMIVMVDGQLTPIYLQSPLCKTELSGKELAENCFRVMESFDLSQSILKQQLVGCAVDGAYIHLNIGKHLSEMVGVTEEWLSVSWDSAHLLELAINDVKRQRKFLWLTKFIKICSMIMKKYSYGKQYEELLETAKLIGEDILQPKQFHTTRFVSSDLRVYETMMRDWSTFYELHEQDSIFKELTGGDLSTRTRHSINSEKESSDGGNSTLKIEEIKSVDFVGKLVGLIDIYNIIVKASVFVQHVNKYPWEYDDAIRHLQESLNKYARLLEQLDLNTTQEMNSIEECEQDVPAAPYTATATTIDYEDIDDIDEDEGQPISSAPTTTYIEQHYQSSFNCIFKERPITRHRGDYDLEDPTSYVRQKLIVLCQELVDAIETRFKDTPQIFLLMKNCLDVSSLYEQVVLTGQQVLVDYGQSALQELINFTIKNSKYIKIDSNVIQGQYTEWKVRCLSEIADENTYNIWTTNGKIATPKVMKTFYTNRELANGIQDFLYFYSLMILKIRSEAVCESAASILKNHIHGNRSLQHTSLDEEVMLHWNAPPLHSATLFITNSLNDYFSRMKDKQWLFYRKSEKYQVWKLVSPGSVVLNRLRKVQVGRLPEPCDIE